VQVPIQPFPAILVLSVALAAPAAADPIRIVALGDSLTAGYGLDAASSFAAELEKALKAHGHDVVVVNAGVSGDTASDGLARVDWSVGDDADAVIVELGANDALRGVDPEITRDALDKLVARLTQHRLPVLLAGMLAPPNLGTEYGQAFDAIYPDLAGKYGALLYPFFLDGVAARPDLNQADGIHPNAAGVAVIVERILPSVEALIARVPGQMKSGALQSLRQRPILSMIRDGGAPCRDCSPASKSPPKLASDWRSFAAGFPGPAG
jgi:acyl-CoA thioesterase I